MLDMLIGTYVLFGLFVVALIAFGVFGNKEKITFLGYVMLLLFLPQTTMVFLYSFVVWLIVALYKRIEKFGIKLTK